MTALIGALRVTLGANTAQYEAGMRRAQSTARRTGQSIQASMLQAQRASARAFQGIASGLGVTLGAAGILAGARAFLSYADAAKSLEAQLRLATRESGNFAQAQDDVRRIADQTRSGLEETASLYAAFQRNSRDLGITQEQAARATQTVSETFKISGASASEAAAGTRQFLQALQSGVLRGDEFNSIMENAPRLARLLADSLRVNVGQLRAMAEQGQITGDKLVRALTDRRFTAGIDAEFRQMPVTFEQAMTRIRNTAIIAFGAFDRGGQFSNALINFAGQGRESFAQIERAAFEAGQDIRATMAGLANVFDPMGQGATSVFEFIKNEARGLRSAIQDILSGLGQIWDAAAFGLSAALGQPDVSILTNRAGQNALGGRFAAGANASIGSPLMNMVAETQRLAANMRQGPAAGRPRPPALPHATSRGRSGGSGEAAARRAHQLEQQAIRDEERYQSELRGFRADILRAQQEQVTDAVARSQIEDQLLDMEREEYNAGLEAKVRLGEMNRTRATELQLAHDRVIEERRQANSLDRQRQVDEENRQILDARNDIQNEGLRQEIDLADTAAERRDLELRLLELTYRQERARLQTIIADESSSRVAVAEAEARLRALDQFRQNEAAGIRLRTQGPLESFLDKLPTTAARANEALQRVAADGLQSIEDGLVAALSGTKSLASAFREMASSIIADLIRIQIQRLITGPLANAVSGLSIFANAGASIAAHSLGGGLAVPGFATGGRINIGGRGGIDRNFLSLNGLPIARVSKGEELNIGRGGGGNVYNIYPQSPNTGDPRRDRQTMLQNAAIVRDTIARSAKTGH